MLSYSHRFTSSKCRSHSGEPLLKAFGSAPSMFYFLIIAKSIFSASQLAIPFFNTKFTIISVIFYRLFKPSFLPDHDISYIMQFTSILTALALFAASAQATFKSPKGNDKWSSGQKNSIQWDTSGLTGSVSLYLCPGGSKDISKSIAKIGSKL
jgi:hypothetical protein